MKRQFANGFILKDHQKLDKTKQQVVETSNGQNVNLSNDNLGLSTIEARTISNLQDDIYNPVECKWINKIYRIVKKRGNDEKLNYFLDTERTSNPVKWISVHYRCLLDCVLTLSEIKSIPWDDLAELTNAFTYLITSVYFQELPDHYPYTKNIVSLRNKLKDFCLITKQAAEMQFCLKFETKKDLFLQRFELSLIFPKMSFHQLQRDFRDENNQHENKF